VRSEDVNVVLTLCGLLLTVVGLGIAVRSLPPSPERPPIVQQEQPVSEPEPEREELRPDALQRASRQPENSDFLDDFDAAFTEARPEQTANWEIYFSGNGCTTRVYGTAPPGSWAHEKAREAAQEACARWRYERRYAEPYWN